MERDFVMRIAKWDDTAFREVMAEYGRDVWNYAFSMTKNKDMADDISQDVFIKVYYRISTYRGESSFKKWLLALTRNTILNYKRASFFRRVTLVEFFKSKETALSAEREAMDQWTADQIWSIVLRLPAKYREVLVLDAKYDLSVKEIAGLLSVPEGTVKSRLARARDQVTDRLKEVLPYEPV